eukprot:1226395-Prymnesium_polylepis.2
MSYIIYHDGCRARRAAGAARTRKATYPGNPFNREVRTPSESSILEQEEERRTKGKIDFKKRPLPKSLQGPLHQTSPSRRRRTAQALSRPLSAGARAGRARHHGPSGHDAQVARLVALQNAECRAVAARDNARLAHGRAAHGGVLERDAREGLLAGAGARPAVGLVAGEREALELVDREALGAPSDERHLRDAAGRGLRGEGSAGGEGEGWGSDSAQGSCSCSGSGSRSGSRSCVRGRPAGSSGARAASTPARC